MVLQDDEKHHSPCGTTTLDKMELFNLFLEKIVLMFLHLLKKNNSVLYRFVHFKGNVGVTDSRLQNRVNPLFCILQLLYSLYWCSFNLSALLRSGSLPDSAQTESEARHMGNDVFFHSKKRKRKKKKLKINVCETSFF